MGGRNHDPIRYAAEVAALTPAEAEARRAKFRAAWAARSPEVAARAREKKNATSRLRWSVDKAYAEIRRGEMRTYHQKRYAEDPEFREALRIRVDAWNAKVRHEAHLAEEAEFAR